MFSSFKNMFRLSKIKLVCFDVDNTLCDYNSAESETEVYISKIICDDLLRLQSKIRSRKHKTLYAESSQNLQVLILRMITDIKRSYVHKNLDPKSYSRELWFKQLFEQLDSDTNLGVSLNSLSLKAPSYSNKYWQFFNKKMTLYKNTISTLDYLKSHNIKLAILADSDGESGIKLDRIKILGIAQYFDYIITTDDTGVNKPSIVNWNKLLRLSGLKGKECMMVGDHPEIDLISAKKLGFVTVWTKQQVPVIVHQKYVDYEIKDLFEVVKLVEKMNS